MFRFALLTAAFIATSAWSDPLPSWRATESKSRIVAFVESVTDPGSPDYLVSVHKRQEIEIINRIALFF